MHKIPLTHIEYQGLVAHGLDIHKPSQLSDAFRQGLAWATAQGDYDSLEEKCVGMSFEINYLKQLLRNVRATLYFSPEDVLAIDAALREDKDSCSKINQCDGCQAGIPLINGTHRMGEPDGYANKIKCTADLCK